MGESLHEALHRLVDWSNKSYCHNIHLQDKQKTLETKKTPPEGGVLIVGG
jgi:hypothetical protein